MFRTVILFALLVQAGQEVGPTIVAKPSEPPRRNFWIIYYDDSFLFAARHYGNSRDVGGNTEPGLFVHSKKYSRWIQILQISTAGGTFGKSQSDDPEAQKKLRFASVGWDFTRYAERPYIDQPMLTSGSIAFPDRVRYDSSTENYELRYFTSWDVPSAETVLYVSRKDLVNAAAQHKDEIDSLVDRLNHQPLWINGAFPELKLPESAMPEEVIAECFKMVGFDKGHVKWHNVLEIRKVDIATAYPTKYSAALIDTDLGRKIILFRYERARWWTRVFDVK